jgi:hypothetical protein
MHQMTRYSLLSAALLLPFGCGGLTSSQYGGTTLATVEGKLTTSSASQSDAPIGITIFWYGSTAPAGATLASGDPQAAPLSCPAPAHLSDSTAVSQWGNFVGQSVVYQPHFPIDFSLPITQVPPRSAQLDLGPLGGSGTMATGFVVAYQDLNGNGSYDFGTPTRDPEPIIATSRTYVLLFLDGHLAGSTVALPGAPANFDTQGFSVLHFDGTSALPPAPLSTPITLVAEPTVETAELGCQTTQEDVVHDASPVAGATHSCLNTTGYIWQSVERPSVCHQVTHTGVVCLGASAPPADWPCN